MQEKGGEIQGELLNKISFTVGWWVHGEQLRPLSMKQDTKH